VHHRMVERLACGRSAVHLLDPRSKLLAALLIIFLLALLPDDRFVLYVPAGLVVLGVIALARLPWWFVFSRTLMVLPFLILVAVFLPWTYGQETLWCFGGDGLCVHREGLLLAASLAVKGVISILWVEMVVFTTPIIDLLAGLRSLKVPPVVLETLSFLFRYLDLIVDEGQRLKRARRARLAGRGRRMAWRSGGGIIGRAFLRAVRRAERIWLAMQARGYRGELLTMKMISFRPADLLLVVAVLAAVLASCALLWKVV
jgi:cobalt/nickel transport system permease protein